MSLRNVSVFYSDNADVFIMINLIALNVQKLRDDFLHSTKYSTENIKENNV